MSRPLRVLALAAGDGINLVLNFLLIPVLARTFDVETYGTYGQVLMIAGFCVTLLSMGLNNILLKDLSQASDKEEIFSNNISSGFLIGLLGMAIVIFSASFVGNYFNNPTIVNNLRYYAPYIPVTIAITSCNAALIYQGKSKAIVIVSVLTNLIRLIGIIAISVYADQALNYIFIFLSILGVLQLKVLLNQIQWKLNYRKIKASNINKQLKEALPLGITVMISSVFTVADGIYVSSLMGVTEFAIYRNGAMFIPLIMSLYAAINSIVLPDVSLLFTNNSYVEIAQLKRKIASLFIFIVYPVVLYFIFFAADLVRLIFSEKYILSTTIFQLYNISLLFRICNAEDLFLVANKARRLPIFYAIVCLFALVGNYVFIHLWGIQGAVLTSLSGTILLLLLIYRNGFKLIGVRFSEIIPFNNILQVLVITIPLILSAVIMGSYIQHPFYFLTIFFPYIVLCYFIFLKLNWLDVYMVRKMVLGLFGENKAIRLYDRIFI